MGKTLKLTDLNYDQLFFGKYLKEFTEYQEIIEKKDANIDILFNGGEVNKDQNVKR